MLDILKTLSATSVPNVLMGLGAVLILLAFVEKIGTHIELPAKRQTLAAITGVTLLFAGIGVTLAPHLQSRDPDIGDTEVQEKVDQPLPKDGDDRNWPPTAVAENESSSSQLPATGRPQTDARASDQTPGSKDLDEIHYAGSLGGLVPPLSMLPAKLVLDSEKSVDHTAYGADSFKNPTEAREVLRDSELVGIEKTYARKSRFCGLKDSQDFYGARFLVRKVRDVETARRIWAIGWEEHASSLGENYWKEGNIDRYRGAYSVDLCYSSHPSVLRQFGARVGNVWMTAGLFVAVSAQKSQWVEDLGDELLKEMISAAKAGG